MALQHIFAGDLANMAGSTRNVPVPLVLRPLVKKVGNCVIGDVAPSDAYFFPDFTAYYVTPDGSSYYQHS